MTSPLFAPQLFIPSGSRDLSFYTKGIGAEELYRFANEDGSVHVAEFSLHGTIFHVHENNRPLDGQLEPHSAHGVTALIGLFVDNVDEYFNKAVQHGAIPLLSPTDFDYHYRQAEIKDPYGHIWVFQKRI